MKILADNVPTSDATPTAVSRPKRPSWAQTEGTPLPLGVTWIEDEQAFNFAVHAEHAESVTLFLYSSEDLAKPILTFPFHFIRNKSGRIWHCKIPLNLFHGRGPVKDHRISFEKTLAWFQHQELQSILGDCVLVDGGIWY